MALGETSHLRNLILRNRRMIDSQLLIFASSVGKLMRHVTKDVRGFLDARALPPKRDNLRTDVTQIPQRLFGEGRRP